MKEPDREVVEEPTTHKKKAQLFLFVLLGILVVALIFDVIQKSFKSSEAPAPEEKKPVAVAPPAVDIQTFEERIEQAARQKEAEKGGVGEVRGFLQKVQEQRARELQARTQSAQEPAGGGFRNRFGLNPEKSSAEIYLEEEQKRAWESRRSPLVVQLGDKTQTQAEADLVPAAVPSAGIRRGDYSRERAFLQEELKRVRDLQTRLLRGEQGVTGGTGSDLTAQNVPEVEVGKPATEQQEGPKPGQVLLSTGTVISAALDQMTMSDYAGSYRAILTRDVYDPSGRYVLFPKGAKVIGKTVAVGGVNQAIQNRMAMTVNWLVLPNGKRVSFNKTVAMDSQGVAALRDKVSYHLIPQILGVAAYASLSSASSRAGSGADSDTTYEGELGESMREQFAPLAAKFLNLVPTVTLRQGTPMRIFVEDDLYVTPWDHVYSGVMPRV